MHVKQMLGHKNLQSTQVYIHIEKAVYGVSNEEEFHVKVAKNKEEMTELLEAGFKYLFTYERLAYLRKSR